MTIPELLSHLAGKVQGDRKPNEAVEMADLLELTGLEPSYDNETKTLLAARVLSADVDAAVDPSYPEVHEKSNNARMGGGGSGAKFMAPRGRRVIDSGTPHWGRHSPLEAVHKADLYPVFTAFMAAA